MGVSRSPTDAPAWALTVAEDGDAARVRVWGDLDIATSARLAAALDEVEGRGRHVTLDLRAVTFMDSSAINLLLRHADRAANNRFILSVIPPPPAVARVLDYAGVTHLLPLVEAP